MLIKAESLKGKHVYATSRAAVQNTATVQHTPSVDNIAGAGLHFHEKKKKRVAEMAHHDATSSGSWTRLLKTKTNSDNVEILMITFIF